VTVRADDGGAGRGRLDPIGVPFDGVMLAGGLTWPQLTQIGKLAIQDSGCSGWSLAIYSPDLDPDHSAARRIVEFVARVAR